MDLDWFFEVYLRQPKLPRLVSSAENNTLNLAWETPDNLPFLMPVEIAIDGKTQRVEMKGGKATVNFTGAAPVIDPNGWILKAQ
jgi:aminopeptidase N